MASKSIYQQAVTIREKEMPRWRTRQYNVLMDFMKQGEVKKVGERDFEIPAETELGMKAGVYNPQGGDMGRGGQPGGLRMVQSYFAMRGNFELDRLSIKASENTGVGAKNPFLRCVAEGFIEFRRIRDKWYHLAGTAIVGTGATHSSSTGYSVYTMDPTIGTMGLYRGQDVIVYDTTEATVKGRFTITAVNTQSLEVTLNGIVPSAVGTDKFALDGVSGASPAGPRGLFYWLSYATSGLTASINRATEPLIISKSVNAASAPYAVEHVMALHDRILLDRADVSKELMAVCAPAQRAAAYNQMMAIQNIMLTTTKAEAVDRLPALKDRDAFMYGGVPHYEDVNMNTTVVPFMIPKFWGRAILEEEDFFQTEGVPGEKGRFIQLMGGSGGPAAATWFGLVCSEQPYTIDPGAQGLVYGLPRPAFH